ncbi:cytochrome P450 [Guyanagaster necrorhizus]|uniref:Cytochrome P450 n=1 Tax=Guyanagaster necrorhizus TaxID=856835 RepID=A0A9P7VKN9_9AGAR|nr:cytochrome P450 [Guyanagaster necrorhizus MCA 3950]KAG7442315.1 cytochrome P450 [Guyanagaster necrorhizus MCA 3950]
MYASAALPLVLLLLCWYRIAIPPRNLRHLPRVAILPLLWSYLRGETEDCRIKRLVLPFSRDAGEQVVLVWVLGRWMVHILDFKLAQELCDNVVLFPKETPDDASLLWRFVGSASLLMSNGEQWRKQSVLIDEAFNARIPIAAFTSLAHNLSAIVGKKRSSVTWDKYSQRFALDAVGSTILGHNFNAMETDNLFVQDYNGVMAEIANPMYVIFPWMECVFPRKKLIRRIDTLVDKFMQLLTDKKVNPGDDMMTFMLKDPAMSHRELRDNMITLFIAGHDTAAGAISTLFYFLARRPDIQRRAREEVLNVLGSDLDLDPSIEQLSGVSLPYLTACIREALRINTPISYIVPRQASRPVQLGQYAIPAHTSLIVNIYAIHHDGRQWASPDSFIPERFLERGWQKSGWLPFALGPRQCPARNFAMYEQRALAAVFLREYQWALPEQSVHRDSLKNTVSPFALTLPHNLELTFTRIEKVQKMPLGVPKDGEESDHRSFHEPRELLTVNDRV